MKYITDFKIVERQRQSDCTRLTLQHPECLPEIRPGQFVECKVPDTAGTYLRRPISIHDVDPAANTIKLLIKDVGNGSHLLSGLGVGDTLNLVYPLGNGFDTNAAGERPLLVGGGVGVAPLLHLAKELVRQGKTPSVLLGARNADGLVYIDDYKNTCTVYTATENGSHGTKGFVTDHPALGSKLNEFTSLLVCGPTPMMKAVAKKAKEFGKPCYVSLENKMACGIGVCLCCVTDTRDGHRCVCTDGPVFEAQQLNW